MWCKCDFVGNIHQVHHVNSKTVKIYQIMIKSKIANKNQCKLRRKDNLKELTNVKNTYVPRLQIGNSAPIHRQVHPWRLSANPTNLNFTLTQVLVANQPITDHMENPGNPLIKNSLFRKSDPPFCLCDQHSSRT